LWALLTPVAAILLAVLLAAWFSLWYARRKCIGLPGPGKGRRLKILERLALSQRSALVLVEYDGRPILLGQSGDRLSLVAGAARPIEDNEAG
jgi:flagellar biogenesis protein FliO